MHGRTTPDAQPVNIGTADCPYHVDQGGNGSQPPNQIQLIIAVVVALMPDRSCFGYIQAPAWFGIGRYKSRRTRRH